MPTIGIIRDMNPKSGMDIYTVSVPAYGMTVYFPSFDKAMEYSNRVIDDLKRRGKAN